MYRGSRRDDTSGLGDWQISQDVWPDGDKSLKALADYVHGKGKRLFVASAYKLVQ